MTQQDGGVINSDGKSTAELNTNGTNDDQKGQNGGDINADINKRIDDLNAQIESLKKESSGKDKKIAQMLSEKELQELNSKTKEEQLEIYKLKAATYERKEAYRQSLKEVGLNPDEFISIVDEKDPALQAARFADVLKKATEKSANEALEKFKTDELKKLGQPPKPNGNTTTTTANIDKNNFLKGIAD